MKKTKDLHVGEVFNSTQDADLWLHFKAGDKCALASIFNQYYDVLVIYGFKIIPKEEVVQDAIQELFLKLWNSRETLGNVTAIKPYLLKCLRRYLAEENKQLARYSSYDDLPEQQLSLTVSHEEALIDQYNSQVSEIKLENALQKLTKRQREIVFLKFNQGMDYEKIAEVTTINLQSIRNIIYQSIKVLKEHLTILLVVYYL